MSVAILGPALWSAPGTGGPGVLPPEVRRKDMKSIARWVVCAVASSAGVAYADAQADMAAKVQAELKKIDARLKLNAEQKDKMKAILAERWQKADELDKEYRAK